MAAMSHMNCRMGAYTLTGSAPARDTLSVECGALHDAGSFLTMEVVVVGVMLVVV